MASFIRKILRPVSTVVFTFVEILVSLLLSALLLPLVLCLVLVNEIIRCFVAVYLRLNCGLKVKLISDGADSIWSYDKPGNGRTTLNITFYRNELQVDNYRELFSNRVINFKTANGFKPYEKLTSIFSKRCGYFCWSKDENFHINNHVRYYPGSEDKIVTESELMETILPELFVDMDDSKPQWEEVIIPKFKYDIDSNKKEEIKHLFSEESQTVSARIFRYHHGYMDGASNLLMWTHCMSEGKEFPYPVNPLEFRIATWKRILYKLSCVMLGATTIFRSLYKARILRNRFVTNQFSGERIFSWTSPIDICQLKEIRTATKMSLPTIIAVIIAGALRKLDEMHPSSKPEFREIPEEVILGLVTALLPYPNINLRNRFTVVHYPVNMSESSRLQKLQMASEAMGKLSRSPISYLNFLMFKFFGRFPGFVIHHMMSNAGLPIIFSNVPMSTRNVKFWDNEVLECAGWTPLLLNTGLGILTIRYTDHMRVCGVTDAACLSEKELKYFLSEVHNEVRLMAEECSQLGRPHQIILEDSLLAKKKIHVIDIESP